jgi:hypothetical protein
LERTTPERFTVPYTYTFYESARFLHITVTGEVTPAAEQEMYRTVSADPRYVRDISILVDRRDSTMKMVGKDVRDFVVKLKPMTEQSGKPRIAVVVGSTVDYGMHRMFQLFAEGVIKHDYHVFRELDKAVEWLGVDVDLSSPESPEPASPD